MLPRQAIYLESIGRSLLSYLTENSGRPSQRIVELADQLRTKANERVYPLVAQSLRLRDRAPGRKSLRRRACSRQEVLSSDESASESTTSAHSALGP